MKHLTSEQISAIVAGWNTSESEQQHAAGCPWCTAEIERLSELLKQFRSSVREWSESSTQTSSNIAPFPQPAVYRDGFHPRRVAWVIAAAALAFAVAVPVYQDVKERELKAQAEADDLLLESVQSQLSRSAPVAMQPLMQLVSPSGQVRATEISDRQERR